MNRALLPLRRGLRGISGLSRQGVIASSRWVRTHPLPSGSRRALWLFPASIMIGVGVSLLIAADLGVAPFDVAISAIAAHTPLSFGQAAWALTGGLFVLSTVLGEPPTARSASFILLNGLTIDVASHLIVAPESLGTRIGLAVVGGIVLATGVATVVYHASAGGSFESLMAVAARRGIDPMKVRLGLELSVLAGGLLAGGSAGPATIVLAVTMSPAIGFGLQAFDDHQVGRRLRLAGESSASADAVQPVGSTPA